jgi:SAM-dependent methyltransferase
MKTLVVIASYGTSQDRYLSRIVNEYRSMSFDVDIVVLSNISKDVAPGVKVVTGLPTKNPWSLPFGHKQIFADRVNDYDLFIYSEDDMLVTERNVHAFLNATQVLKDDEIAGFIRFEQDQAGKIYYPEVHANFHWDPSSVRLRKGGVFAFFSCEHSACYLLTRDQLRRAIASGGFLVKPYEGKYDLLCTAATDPYTRCGFTKLIGISSLSDFMVHHLPDKYIGRMGIEQCAFLKQIQALAKIGQNGCRPRSLFSTETRLRRAEFSKDYYESVLPKMISLIPEGTRSVLSVGSGSGATESYLATKGYRVTSVPLDPVISSLMKNGTVEILDADFNEAFEDLRGRRFDCVLLSNVLHLAQNPVELLRKLSVLVKDDAVTISLVPNLARIRRRPPMLASGARLTASITYEQSGVQFTSPRIVRSWYRHAGLKVEEIVDVPSLGFAGLPLRAIRRFVARELIVVAKSN